MIYSYLSTAASNCMRTTFSNCNNNNNRKAHNCVQYTCQQCSYAIAGAAAGGWGGGGSLTVDAVTGTKHWMEWKMRPCITHSAHGNWHCEAAGSSSIRVRFGEHTCLSIHTRTGKCRCTWDVNVCNERLNGIRWRTGSPHGLWQRDLIDDCNCVFCIAWAIVFFVAYLL